MAKFPEAEARIMKNVFVGKNGRGKVRASKMKILAGKIRPKKINSKYLRPLRKK